MTKIIELTKGQVTQVDDDDYEKYARYSWRASLRTGYQVTAYAASRTIRLGDGRHKSVYLHRIIMGLIHSSQQVDHINHDTLDNRKENLRVVSQSTNQRNKRPQKGGSSRFTGVVWRKENKKWVAQTRHHRKTIHLGSYDTEIEAAIAYNNWVLENIRASDQHAYLNKITEEDIKGREGSSRVIQPTLFEVDQYGQGVAA